MTRIIVAFMIAAIVVAHVFLWRSDMAAEFKVVFTTINAVAWTIVLAPIFLVGRWLETVERRNRDARDEPERGDR
jgi:hypothetical protein